LENHPFLLLTFCFVYISTKASPLVLCALLEPGILVVVVVVVVVSKNGSPKDSDGGGLGCCTHNSGSIH